MEKSTYFLLFIIGCGNKDCDYLSKMDIVYKTDVF